MLHDLKVSVQLAKPSLSASRQRRSNSRPVRSSGPSGIARKPTGSKPVTMPHGGSTAFLKHQSLDERSFGPGFSEYLPLQSAHRQRSPRSILRPLRKRPA